MADFIHPIEQLVFNTVRIESITNTSGSIGTGYIFGFCSTEKHFKPCIVTNKHVIENCDEGILTFHLKNKRHEVIKGKYHTIKILDFASHWIHHPNPEIDLAILPLWTIMQRLARTDIYLHYIHLTISNLVSDERLDEISSMEKVVMVGYPIGLSDVVNNRPLVRTGVTSTHPKIDYNNNPEFLIDCASYPGSSGSPVFLGDIGFYLSKSGALSSGTRVDLLGTLYATPEFTLNGEIQIQKIPTELVPNENRAIPTNLGVVIQANKLMDFESLLKKLNPTKHIRFVSI